MYNFLNKHGQTLAFGLGLVIILIFIINGFPKASALESQLGMALSETKAEDRVGMNFFNFGLYASIALIAVAALAMLIFGVVQIATNFKSSIKGVVAFAALIVLFFVLKSTASGDATGSLVGAIDKFKDSGAIFTANTLKGISAGILTAGVLILAAAVSFVYSEVSGFFK
ncbi:MAG: hypothetical protein KDC85_00610 [Saprospiraceae bacterium]|nr:hypothetical protein [Saprospiraceae bacterium]MCB9326068.1 hypothetical protein [Lewinellaceae bacterium]